MSFQNIKEVASLFFLCSLLMCSLSCQQTCGQLRRPVSEWVLWGAICPLNMIKCPVSQPSIQGKEINVIYNRILQVGQVSFNSVRKC